MGAPYEFNWYLVIANYDKIKRENNNKYITTKSECRIYPINSEIPLIIKQIGCIGIVKIVSFTIRDKETLIEFEYVEKINENTKIAQHYYNLYKLMKNK